MSLVFADSFDHYALGNADVKAKWGTAGGGIVAAGRRGTQGLRGDAMRMMGEQTTVICGGAFFVERGSSLTPGSTGAQRGTILFEFLSDDITYVGIGVSTDGRIRVYRGRYPQVLASESPGQGPVVLATTDPGVITFASWQYVELRVAFAYEGGAVEVRVNRDTVVDLPNVQTIPRNRADAGETYINPLFATQFYCSSDTGVVDDVYLLNGDEFSEDAPLNDFLGDLEVLKRLPVAAGLYSESSIIGTVPEPTRWENTRSADQGVSAVQFAAEGDRDSYQFEDIPYDEATVHAVQLVAQCRKADSGSARATAFNSFEAGDVETDTVTALPEAFAPSASETMAFKCAQLNESAQGPWTKARFDDSEFGLRRVAIA